VSGFLRFYAPLGATSLLLTATNPLLTATLSRSVNPAATLAAFGVAFSLCGVLYAPLLVGQQVVATRLLNGRALEPLLAFWLRMGLACSAAAALVAFTPIGMWAFRGAMGVSGDVEADARLAMAVLVPVPFLTALRSVHQGRLVARHHTHPIAVATGVRTATLAGVAVGLSLFVPGGAWIGAAAFTAGLAVETAMVAFARTGAGGDSRAVAAEGVEVAAIEDRMLRFSMPLVVNVLLWWSTPLFLNAVLARTAFPAEAIAAFVVVEAVAWFLAAPVGQLQQVGIALVDCRQAHRAALRWGLLLALAVAGAMALISLPWVRVPLLAVVFGLDPGLVADVGAALPIAVAYPLLYGHRQYYQGLFVACGRPDAVGWGALLRIVTVVAVAGAMLDRLGQQGAVLAVSAAVAGLAAEALYLERMARRHVMPGLPIGARTAPTGPSHDHARNA
jgi:hypothetical protein